MVQFLELLVRKMPVVKRVQYVVVNRNEHFNLLCRVIRVERGIGEWLRRLFGTYLVCCGSISCGEGDGSDVICWCNSSITVEFDGSTKSGKPLGIYGVEQIGKWDSMFLFKESDLNRWYGWMT